MPEFYKWTVEFSVHKDWVADGFDLTDNRALGVLSADLSYAHVGNELRARVIKAPRRVAILAE